MKKEKTKYTGVWAQLSSTKKHRGKPDKCYYIVFRKNSKVVWEKIGWEGDGYTAKAASNVRSDRLSSLRNGKKLPQDKKVIPLFKDVVEKYLEWCKTNKIIRACDPIHWEVLNHWLKKPVHIYKSMIAKSLIPFNGKKKVSCCQCILPYQI